MPFQKCSVQSFLLSRAVLCSLVQSCAVLCSYIFMSSCLPVLSCAVHRFAGVWMLTVYVVSRPKQFSHSTTIQIAVLRTLLTIYICVCVCVCVSICTRIHIAHHGRCTGPTGCDIERLVRSSGRLACWCVAQHRARCNCTLTHSL